MIIDEDAHEVEIQVNSDDLMSYDFLIGNDFLNTVDLSMKKGQISISRPQPEGMKLI